MLWFWATRLVILLVPGEEAVEEVAEGGRPGQVFHPVWQLGMGSEHPQLVEKHPKEEGVPGRRSGRHLFDQRPA